MRPSASTTSAAPGSMPLVDGDDPAVADADVGAAPRCAGAVDDGPAPNHPVELAAACPGHARPPRSPPRRYLTRVSGSPSGRRDPARGGRWSRRVGGLAIDDPSVVGPSGAEVLRRAVPRVARLRHRVVGAARPARCAARPAGRGHRHPRRRHRPGRPRSTGPLTFVGIVVRRQPGAQPGAGGGERQPRQPHRQLAERPADGGLHHARGHRPPRAGRPDRRPHRRPRLRPRAWPAHRCSISMGFIAGGPADDRGRPRRRDRAVRVLVVGAARAAGRVGLDALAAPRVGRVAGPQHRRGPPRAAPRRLRLPAGGRRAGGQGGAAVRPGRLGDRPLRRPPPARSTSSSGRRPACASGRCSAACVIVLAANALVLWAIGCADDRRTARPRRRQRVPPDRRRRERDRLRRAQLGARRQRRAGGGRPAPRGRDGRGRRAPPWRRAGGRAARAGRSGSATCTFTYPGTDRPILDGFDLTIPAGSSLAIVGQNGAGKTTLAKLLCRLYDPQSGAHRGRRRRPARARPRGVARRRGRGVPGLRALRAVAPDQRRSRPRSERARSTPRSTPRWPTPARTASPASTWCCPGPTTAASTSRAGSGSGSRSPGRWPRCGSAPGSCCSTSRPPSSTCGARPRSSSGSSPRPAQCTTILVSHRFSTVRLADRICVVEHGRVVELGSHDELMALGGRYRTMFDMQASRFVELDERRRGGGA